MIPGVEQPLVVGPAAKDSHHIEAGGNKSEGAGTGCQKFPVGAKSTGGRSKGDPAALEVDVVHIKVLRPNLTGEDVGIVKLVTGVDRQPIDKPGSPVIVMGCPKTDRFAFSGRQEENTKTCMAKALVMGSIKFSIEGQGTVITPGDQKTL